MLRVWLGGVLRGWAEKLTPSPPAFPALPPPLPFAEAAAMRPRSLPPAGPSAEELNARAASLLESARSDVLGRIKVVNETTERETLAVGSALQAIVKEARAQTEEARAALQQLSGSGAGNTGVPQLAARQSRAVTEYLQRMSGIITRHDETVQSSHESSQHIAAIGKSVEKVAFQARLLSLNAAIEAARLGGQGSAFGVIADEMTRLSTEMDVANRKISDLAGALLKCLPEIAAQSTDLRGESATFSERMNQELVELQESSATFERRITDTLTSGDERVARVVSCSHEALSHLSFQDACSQRLLSIDAVLKQVGRRLSAGSDDAEAGFEDVQRNSMFNAGEVVSLRDASETASDEPSATADAGEVMLF